MLSFDYTLENYYAAASAVGVIVLQTDEVIEQELRQWLPDSVQLFHSRIPNALDINPTSLRAMQDEIPHAVQLLPDTVNFKVIVYGCTSGTTVIGEQQVRCAVQSVLPNVSVTNPLSAVKARLTHLDVNRVGLLTPYSPDVSHALAEHLTACGFCITCCGSFHEHLDSNVCRISRESILKAIQLIGANEQCDVVFASCTNLRTLDILDHASQLIGKPVLSSNSALAWHIRLLISQTAD